MDRDKAIRAAKLTAKQVSSHKAADRVADLLRQGRASEVTNDLMDQADPQRLHQHYTSGNTGVDMPMDKASRMARAGQMGFNTGNKLYHGSVRDFNSFIPSQSGKVGPGVYMTPNERKAGIFSGYEYDNNPRIEKLLNEGNEKSSQVYGLLATNRPATMEARQAVRTNESAYDDRAEHYRKKFDEMGFDGVSVADERTILDPTNIRSQFARFDPRLAHLSHLSASTGGAMELARHATAVGRAGGQVAPSKYMPNVPRAVHADGGRVGYALGGRKNEKDDLWWHGSPSGDLRGGVYGLHLGTKESAIDALRARIGVPADGSMWDGTKEYGKTLLAGQNTLNKMGKYLVTGHNSFAPKEDYYPHQHPEGMPWVGNRVPVDPTWKPSLRPFKIVGKMNNDVYRPLTDRGANSAMKASLTKGNAKNGYYYRNDGEDEGSISAAVPNGSHLVPADISEDPDITKADGGEVESKRDFLNDNPGGEWLEGKQARAAQYPDRKFMVGATTGVIGGRSSMFLPTHILKGIAGLNDEVRTSGVHKYDSLLSDAREGGFDPDQKGNKVVVAVNHYGQPYLLEGNTRVAVAHSMGIPKVKAEVRYWNGAENVDGPMHPEKVFGMASDNPDIGKADGGEVDGDDDGITAYHGSPHSFDQFNIANLGTGEGAQAYGHGLYFAGNEGVARSYRDQLSGNNIDARNYFKDGKILPSIGDVWQLAHDAVKAAANIPPDHARAIATQVQDWISQGKKPETFLRYNQPPVGYEAAYKAAADAWSGVSYNKNKGHMYKVKLNVKPHELLDWDKPLSEQHPRVQRAIKEWNDWRPQTEKLPKELILGSGTELNGSHIYQHMVNIAQPNNGNLYGSNAKGQEFASGELSDLGLKGIRYLDAGSRAKSYNVKLSYKGKPFVDGQFEPQFAKSKAEADKIAREYQDKGYDAKIDETGTHNYVMFHHDPVKVVEKYEYGGTVAKATGGPVMGYVPMASLTVPKLAVARAPQYQQQQGGVGKFSDSLNSLMDTVEGFKKKPEADAAVESPSAASEGHAPKGVSDAAAAAYGRLVDAYGQPLTINSAYRDPKHNAEVGGADNSQHTHGNAYDIDVSNMPHEERVALANLAWDAGFRGMGFYDNSLHFDVGDPRGWGPSHSRDSIPEWAQPFTEERYGYSGGGSAMDDDNQDTSGVNNVESLSLARSLRNINSDEHTDPVKNIFANLTAGQKEAQKGYEMAHANGEFDDFRIGDTFVYKHAANPTPMKIIGFSMRHADSFPQGKRVYNNHVPALDMEDQIAGKKVNKYAVEWFRDNLHKYDFVSGKPRAVKAGGGMVSKALALTRGFTKDGKSAIDALKPKGK